MSNERVYQLEAQILNLRDAYHDLADRHDTLFLAEARDKLQGFPQAMALMNSKSWKEGVYNALVLLLDGASPDNKLMMKILHEITAKCDEHPVKKKMDSIDAEARRYFNELKAFTQITAYNKFDGHSHIVIPHCDKMYLGVIDVACNRIVLPFRTHEMPKLKQLLTSSWHEVKNPSTLIQPRDLFAQGADYVLKTHCPEMVETADDLITRMQKGTQN